MKKLIIKLLLVSLLIICPNLSFADNSAIRVLVWSEGVAPKDVYPHGVEGAIGKFLTSSTNLKVSTATFSDSDYGLAQKKLDNTDVLIMFSHFTNKGLPDSVAQRIVHQTEDKGMGLILLHSAHNSKPLQMLLHTSGEWADYDEEGKSEQITVLLPDHPIAKGVTSFTIPETEMHKEPLDVPQPESVVMEGYWPASHNTSRELMTWTVGKGRLVYIRAGHETYPIYFMPAVQQIILNSVNWAAKKTVTPQVLLKLEAIRLSSPLLELS